MKTTLHISAGRLPLLLFCSMLLWAYSCNEKEVIPDAENTYSSEEKKMLKEEYLQVLPRGEKEKYVWDSLVNSLKPILLLHPSDRPARTLQGIRQIWEPVFGSYDRMANYIGMSAETYLTTGKTDTASRLLLTIGHFCNVEGDHLQGTSYTQRAYDLARENRDTSTMGWALSQSSESFIFSADSASAMGYLNRAMSYAETTQDDALKVAIYIRIGAMYNYVGDIKRLYNFNRKALVLSREKGLKGFEQLSLVNIAYALKNLGNPLEAINLLREEFIPGDNHLSDATAFMQMVLFESYLALGNFEEAEAALSKSCQISEESGFFFGISYCKKGLVNLHEKKGDLKKAIKQLRDFYAHRELILSNDAQKDMRSIQIAQLEKEKEWTVSQLEQKRREQEFQLKSNRNRMLLLAFGACFLIFLRLAYIMGRNKIRQASQHRQLAEVKLHLLREKMNPHFMFNAINGIQNQILKSNSIEAYNYLGKFAELLRMITKSEASFFTDLQEEVDFLTTYLDLEKLRFRQQFEYDLTVDDDLRSSNVLIPSMMIQPFVENAIIHGLSLLPRKGVLTIRLEKFAGNIRCTVRDNGRGRVAANLISFENKSKHLSVASDIANRRIGHLHDSGYEDTKIEIEDLYEDGKACGTLVTLILPIMKADAQIE